MPIRRIETAADPTRRQDLSEVTGPAFGPSLQRLYFSSQRGTDGLDILGLSGITYEVSGPFFV